MHKCLCLFVTSKLLSQVEDLKWEVEQRQREIEAQKQQLEMIEQCHQKELDNLQMALQASFVLKC